MSRKSKEGRRHSPEWYRQYSSQPEPGVNVRASRHPADGCVDAHHALGIRHGPMVGRWLAPQRHHLGCRQLKVEDADVLGHVGQRRRLGHRGHPLLRDEPQGHLGRRAVVPCSSGCERRVGVRCRQLAPCERRVGLQHDRVVGSVLVHNVIVEPDVIFHLVYRGAISGGCELLHLTDVKVGHPKSPNLAGRLQLRHGAPRIEATLLPAPAALLTRWHRHHGLAARLHMRRVGHRQILREEPRPMKHEQIQPLHPELAHRRLERRKSLVVAHVPLREHSHDENVISGHARCLDGAADGLKVAVHPGGVQCAASILEVEKHRGEGGVGRGATPPKGRPEPAQRHLHFG
mmetsp:Transcript_30169/g.90436  ORF Transcript_30169/g.90436 Transcript_30169/m.90436 type:complete len:346 (+) Transcript_30169:56-1093(+)